MSEPLEDKKYYKLFINPDSSESIFKAYKKAQESFWVEEEIDAELKKDSINWPSIDPRIQNLIIHQIAFFLIGDGRVNQTISDHIESRITDREVLVWYNFQKMMEDIHNIVYVKLADAYVRDAKEKNKIFNAAENFPIIKKKINWLRKWLGENNDINKLEPDTVKSVIELKNAYLAMSAIFKKEIPGDLNILFNKLDEPKPMLAKQILINLIMEGLFFQGSFCIIFWVNHQYGGKLPGLTKANEFISRDEGMHTDFGIGLYIKKIMCKLPQKEVHEIMNEAVEIEIEFMEEALPSDLLNMNPVLMAKYIKFVADKLLSDLGYDTLYNVTNPFEFMKKQSVSVRISDFFMDANVSEYGHHLANSNTGDTELDFGEDF